MSRGAFIVEEVGLGGSLEAGSGRAASLSKLSSFDGGTAQVAALGWRRVAGVGGGGRCVWPCAGETASGGSKPSVERPRWTRRVAATRASDESYENFHFRARVCAASGRGATADSVVIVWLSVAASRMHEALPCPPRLLLWLPTLTL